MESELLDNSEIKKVDKYTLKKEKKILFIVLATLTIINFLIAPFGFEKRAMFGPGGEDKIGGVLIVGVAIWGFLLGLILSLFPHKNLHYKEKYFTASLLAMCIVQLLMTITIGINIIF